MEPMVAVRRALGDEVRTLARLTRWAVAGNVVYLLATWALALGGIAVFWTWPTWFTLVFAFVLVAARQQALLNIEHECVHSKFVRGKRWNEVVGVLAASPVGSPFYSARARHLVHHRLLAADDDPDAELHRGDDKATKLGLLRHFVLGVLGAYAFMVLVSKSSTSVDPATRGRDRRNLVLAQLAVLGLMWGLFAWWVYPVLWLAPVATLTAGAHLLRNFCEHAVVEGEEAEHANRLISIRSNPIERFVVAPFFMNYHAEHHLFPWVPARRLPDVQQRLTARPDAPARLMRGSYLGALVHHLRALPRA